MKCERCEAQMKAMVEGDYCDTCSKDLCDDCMEDGSCGRVPAKSGMDADEANRIDNEEGQP